MPCCTVNKQQIYGISQKILLHKVALQARLPPETVTVNDRFYRSGRISWSLAINGKEIIQNVAPIHLETFVHKCGNALVTTSYVIFQTTKTS